MFRWLVECKQLFNPGIDIYHRVWIVYKYMASGFSDLHDYTLLNYLC